MHHTVRPELSTKTGTTKGGNIQERPMFAIHLTTLKKRDTAIKFDDSLLGGPSIQWALDIINVNKKINKATMNLRFDTNPQMVNDYYKQRMVADLAANRAPAPNPEKLLTNVKSF